jgi:hypothetical protein
MAYGVSDTESGGESPFHNSMNYRSIVVRGTATAIIEPVDKLVALEVITDHIAPMRGTACPPSEIDVKKTLVLSLPLTKASANVRCGGPMMTMIMMMMMTWTARTGLVPFHRLRRGVYRKAQAIWMDIHRSPRRLLNSPG